MEKDIDLNGIYFSFLRNKFKILLISIFFGFGGVIYALSQPRVWKGSFEIVMDADASKNTEVDSKIQLANLVNRSSDSTQLEILRSPLVLTPVYNYYNEILKNENLIRNNISYERGFVSKLDIIQKPGSQVLKVSFEDIDKKRIVGVLNKLSSIYQDYSNDARTKKLRNSIDFIQSQIEIAKINSETSIKDLQEFNIKNNLGTFDGFILDDSASNVSGYKRPKRFEGNFAKLALLESELVRMKSVYKPNSSILKNMIKTKNQYEKSLKRPSEILNEYRNKLIKAQRDEKIHENLISQLYLLEFEKANNKEPWQLISNPRILENPVKPQRKRIVFLSSSFGVIISFLMFLFFDKKVIYYF